MDLNADVGMMKLKTLKNQKRVNLKSVGAIGAFSNLHKQTQKNKVQEIGNIFSRN